MSSSSRAVESSRSRLTRLRALLPQGPTRNWPTADPGYSLQEVEIELIAVR